MNRPVSMHTGDFLGHDRRKEDDLASAYTLHLEEWDGVISGTTEILRDIGISQDIDEIALMFDGQFEALRYISQVLLFNDVSHFNAAIDVVATEPIESDYEVRYDFLQPAGKPYRVECMTILRGVSPLHSVLLADLEVEGGPVPIHLSFKCSSLKEYEAACKKLDASFFALAQECSSNYGQFSYWKGIGDPLNGMYLKPRFNNRDAVST